MSIFTDASDDFDERGLNHQQLTLREREQAPRGFVKNPIGLAGDTKPHLSRHDKFGSAIGRVVSSLDEPTCLEVVNDECHVGRVNAE